MSSEVNNEGLEVVATLTVSFDEGDGGSAIEQVETHMLLDEGAHDLCLHSEALAGYAVLRAHIAELDSGVTLAIDAAAEYRKERDQLRAELAALTAKLDASKFCADVADDLRAELAAIKPDYCEAIADGMEMRKELDELKAQGPVAFVEEGPYSDAGSDGYHYEISERLPIGTNLYAAPVAKQVVMPERANACHGSFDYQTGWNDYADKYARLNAADQEGGQDE